MTFENESEMLRTTEAPLRRHHYNLNNTRAKSTPTILLSPYSPLPLLLSNLKKNGVVK
jgi:hypothetical protein